MDVEWWPTFRRDLDDEVVKRPAGVLARDLEDEISTRSRLESEPFTESQDPVPLSVHRASSLADSCRGDRLIETPAKIGDGQRSRCSKSLDRR